MSRVGLFAGVTAVTFVVFLVANAPAELINRVAPAEVRLTGLQGSLWAGRAASLRVGQLRLGATRWRLSPWRLLLGRLAGDIDTALPGGFARGQFAIGLGGQIRLEAFSAAGPVASLVEAAGMGLPFQAGQLAADITVLEIRDGWPQRAIGELRVREIALVYRNGQPVQDQLATFELRFDVDAVPASGIIEGALTDLGGPLEVAGRLQLMPPANYELEGRAAPRPGAPQEMQQALVMLGPENPAGGRDFSFAGSL